MHYGQFVADEIKPSSPLFHPQPRSLAGSRIPPLTIYTLGRFTVYRGSDSIPDSAWKRRKAKSLFKLLLLAPQRQLLKDLILEWLWPDQDPDQAANNLHRTLFVLRRILQPDLNQGAESHYILFKDTTLILNAEVTTWLDVEEFERLIQLGRQQADPLPHYEAARTLYQGDFLPEDLYEDWASSHRQRYGEIYCALVRQMAHLYSQRAAYEPAIHCLQDLLRLEPAHEEAHRELMCLYAQTGQRHQALSLYQQLCRTLQHELGVEPAVETTALYQAMVEDRWRPALPPAPSLLPVKAPAYGPKISRWQPLIGRETELGRLEEVLRRVESGQGCVMILRGEQGVGKTRLAEEVASRARARGMRVLYGAAYEQEGHLPYGPFVEAIRSALTGQAAWDIRAKLGPLANDLARLMPELAGAELTLPAHPEAEVGQERQRLFDAVAATFTMLAHEGRLVVLLDDLHAAGESSLQLLHYLARRMADLPLLILCTVREEEAQRGTPIARLCRELFTHQLGQHLKLSPLNLVDTTRLCTELLGQGVPLPDLGEAIYYLTEGNPFFIQEIGLTLMETHKIELADGCWRLAAGGGLVIPARVQEVVGLRLERLSPEAYRLASLAAVVGREFSYAVLQAANQWDPATLVDLLDEMLGAYLIEETGAGYRFRHGLIRQVLYEELTSHRRVWLHEQVAQALERLSRHQLDEQAAIFVYHYERAERYETAFHYLIRAGDRARATYALGEAMDYYNRAISLCQQHRQLATTEIMTGLLQRRAQTYLTLSDFDAAITDLEQLLENSRRTNDRFLEGEALYQVGLAHYWAHRLGRAAAYLDQAIGLAETLSHDELRTKALKLRDILNSTRGQAAQSSSVELARPTDNVQPLPAEEHWGLAMLAHLRSDFEDALHHAQACVELGQSFSNSFLVLGGYFVRGMSDASLGHYQLALEHLRQALDLSEATGDRFWRARLLNTVGWVYRELFDLEQAIRFDQASLELARAGKPCLTEAEGNALANLAADYLLRQDYGQARLYLAEGLNSSRDEPFMRWRYRTRMLVLQGRLELTEGNIQGALTAADEALAITLGNRAPKNIARAYRLRGEALLEASRIHKARAALRHALDVSLSVRSPALIWPCHLALARLEEAEARLDLAQTHYFCAAETLSQVAAHLTDPNLVQSFFSAPPVQFIFSNAICSIPLK